MNKKPWKITPNDIDKMVKFHKEGYSAREIGKMMNITHNTVSYHLKKRNIVLPIRGAGITRKSMRDYSDLDHTKIPLTKGKFALIDEEDYEKLSKHNWSYSQEYGGEYAIRRSKKGEIGCG